MSSRIIAIPLLSFALSAASPVFADADVLSASPGKIFSDVSSTHPYTTAIGTLARDKVITGHADGTFHPEAFVNRAELLAMSYRVKGLEKPYNPSIRCFLDVLPAYWYAPYVCAARDARVIGWYADRKFHGERNVTLSEAVKIIAMVNGLIVQPPLSGEIWYKPYLDILAQNNYLPPSLRSVGQQVTRGEAAEMLYRVRQQKHDAPRATLATLQTSSCQVLGEETDPRFDMERVRAAWFSWINDVRKEAGLPAYEHNRQLDRTAVDWAKTMKQAGVISHKRNPGDPYYDYFKINQWFADRGVTVKNINRVTHTENIGGGVVSCMQGKTSTDLSSGLSTEASAKAEALAKGECTDELIAAIRPTFDFYMNEKGKKSHAHYDSVMNTVFTQIGFGVALSGNKVYSTTHYATVITSDPVPVCIK